MITDTYNLSIVLTFLTISLINIFYFVLLNLLRLLPHHKNNKHKNNKSTDGVCFPKISVIVPTYNEEKVIESKLQCLLKTEYPKDLYEIIVVDSGSNDNTVNIVKKFEEDGVILLRQKSRLGKANALNYALRKAKGDIIIITDANAKFEPKAIKEMVLNFDNDVGGVLPRWAPSGNIKIWDKIFGELHHIYHLLESKIDSAFFTHGELFAFRKDLVSQIDERTVSDDLEIALRIRKKGFRIKYVSDIFVTENIPKSFREVKKQKIRRIFGITQALIKHRHFIFNSKYGLYGIIIFPFHFFQIFLQPFLILYLLASIVIKFMIFIIEYYQQFSPLILFIPFFILVFTVISSKFREVISIACNAFLLQIFMVHALLDIIKGRTYHVWEKIESTRQNC